MNIITVNSAIIISSSSSTYRIMIAIIIPSRRGWRHPWSWRRPRLLPLCLLLVLLHIITIYIYIYIYMHMYTCICIICVYIYIYIYIHTLMYKLCNYCYHHDYLYVLWLLPLCVCAKQTPPEKKDPWAERLGMRQIRGRGAVSAEGLQGKGRRMHTSIMLSCIICDMIHLLCYKS